MKKFPSIESLETRIAPASLITFTDVDGDQVTVKASKGDLTGHLVFTDIQLGKQLTKITVTDPVFQGANLSVTVKKSSTGDGFANVGFIDATGIDLGKVAIKGDLGGIDAGDGNTTSPAIKSLTVKSMGAYGVYTQAPTDDQNGGTPTPTKTQLLPVVTQLVTGDTSLLHTLQTTVQTLLGQGGVTDTSLQRILSSLDSNLKTLLDLGDSIPDLDTATLLGLANVTKDVIGLLNLENASHGSLAAPLVSLLQDISPKLNEVVHTLGAPLGLGGTNTDALAGLQQSINHVVDLLGQSIGTTVPSQLLTSLDHAISAVASNGQGAGGLGGLLGGILGGNLGSTLQTLVSGLSTTLTSLLGNPQSVSLGAFAHSLVDLQADLTTALSAGGLTPTVQGLLQNVTTAANNILALPQMVLTKLSGDLTSVGSGLGLLPDTLSPDAQQVVDNVISLIAKIGPNLSGVLTDGGTIASSVLHDLSSAQTNLASLLGSTTGDLGNTLTTTVTILLKDIQNILGTPGTPSTPGTDPAVPTNPGQPGGFSSDIKGNIGSLKIAKDANGVFLNVLGSVKSINIGGSLVGGTVSNTGEIFVSGDIGSLKIGKNILGGTALNTGLVESNGAIKQLVVGGSVVGGIGNSSGEISIHNDSNLVKIRGDLMGNTGLFSASINSTNGRIGTVKIGGSVISGWNDDSGSIRVQGDIGNLNISGSVTGDSANPVFITAAAMKSVNDKTNSAFKSVKIGGHVAYTNLLAGYDNDLKAVNGHAQIGNVVVGHDWVASNVVAGVQTNDQGLDDFGVSSDQSIQNVNARTASITSKIASICIKGAVSGTGSDTGDHFGFVAQQICKFTVGSTAVVLKKGGANDMVNLSQTTGADVSVLEIGAQVVV